MTRTQVGTLAALVGVAEFDVRYDVIFGTFALKRRTP
jgi:hypothetical protein